MSAGFKWWDYLHSDFLSHNPHVPAALVGAGVIVGASVYYRSTTKRFSSSVADMDLVPSEKFGLRSVLDGIGSFVQGVAKDNIGHHYQPYLPLLFFIFMWTLVNNLMGVFPGLGSATTSLNSTLSMGVVVFLYYNFQGFREHGFKYLEQYTGHLHGVLLLFLGPLMFVIETISHAVRPLTLGIRLRSNMNSDHMVHGIFVDLFSRLGAFITESIPVVGQVLAVGIEILGPIPFVVLGLMVCVIQSFVFTVLTAIYIGLAVAHEDH